MNFEVRKHAGDFSSLKPGTIVLFETDWDDWFKYETLYQAWYIKSIEERIHLGGVKIGEVGMDETRKKSNLPSTFETLNECFFSLGQDDNYYVLLHSLGEVISDEILNSLRDIAKNDALYREAIKHDVTKTSLMRDVSVSSATGQFRRIARGLSVLTEYKFSFKTAKGEVDQISLDFSVTPNSMPPSNIHVLIGRNGVGKTTLLNNMIKSLTVDLEREGTFGVFDSNGVGKRIFANTLLVSFSAFDETSELIESKQSFKHGNYKYIGLRKIENGIVLTKSHDDLIDEFVKSVSACISGRLLTWGHALKMLESDPVFKEIEVGNLKNNFRDDDFDAKAKQLFKKLSSGHKIVLLSICQLVESIEEKSLVIIDEPEGHLHPPLLSAFIRALSNLLVRRNGVAIIATHSPVVLQEVPSSCVWKLRRKGSNLGADRLNIESFGENIGTLTREVFGLEVDNSGFHFLIRNAVEEKRDFEEVLDYFGGQLGMEAQAIAFSLLNKRKKEGVIVENN